MMRLLMMRPEILSNLTTFFRDRAPLAPGDRLAVAFSGGPDSTALLLALAALPALGPRRLLAVHVDHGMDPGSAGRAAHARRLAEGLDVPFLLEHRPVPHLRRAGESPEAAARRVRYAALEEVRRRAGARWTATAHHRDDQAETVLLRLLFGSGLEGLGGIRPVHGAVVRPLLDTPRRDLLALVEAAGAEPAEDPTNADLAVPRNRARRLLLPRLDGREGLADGLAPRLARVAARAQGAGERLASHLARHLTLQETPEGLAVERAALERLPPELLPFAFAWLHRRAGAPYPAGGSARAEILRQLGQGRGGHAGCDAGGGWRWEARGGLLTLRGPAAQARQEPVPDFSYTFQVPGSVRIPEIGVRVRLSRRTVEPWMLAPSSRHALLALPLPDGTRDAGDAGDAGGHRVTVRNRRPGDRLRPFGAGGSRKLKEVLIDRRVPRLQRARLPLVCAAGRIAWVPGVTIDESFRVAGDATAWLAELAEVAWPAEETPTCP